MTDYAKMWVVAWTDPKTGQQDSRRFPESQESAARALLAKKSLPLYCTLYWVGGIPNMPREPVQEDTDVGSRLTAILNAEQERIADADAKRGYSLK